MQHLGASFSLVGRRSLQQGEWKRCSHRFQTVSKLFKGMLTGLLGLLGAGGPLMQARAQAGSHTRRNITDSNNNKTQSGER